ncbi:MAG: hypothetical protein AAGC56_01215 [Pseudomonadota bacterium]
MTHRARTIGLAALLMMCGCATSRPAGLQGLAAANSSYGSYLAVRDFRLWSAPSVAAAPLRRYQQGEFLVLKLHPFDDVWREAIDEDGRVGYVFGKPFVRDPATRSAD